jgi:hypothetical protein
MNLKHLTDKTLLSDTKKLVARERSVSLEVLHHFKEIEKRRLYSDLGYGSMFEYAIKELCYSDASAFRRIKSARLLKEMPFLEKKISEGSLTLTNLAMAGQLFKNEGIENPILKREIIEKIENTSSRECGKTLMDFQTTPVVPKESMVVSSPAIITVKFNLTNETMALFDEIKNVLAHNRLTNDEILKKTFKSALVGFKNKKFKIHSKQTPAPPSPSTTRYIPAIIKKQVFNRDKGRCVKCKSSYKLEYDHVKPYAQGGEHTVENLRLLCFSCNQRRTI